VLVVEKVVTEKEVVLVEKMEVVPKEAKMLMEEQEAAAVKAVVVMKEVVAVVKARWRWRKSMW
jgi:hypothetical protein